MLFELGRGRIMNKEEARMIEIIRGMSKTDFHSRVIKGIAKDRAFGALVTFGADSLDETERTKIGVALSKIDPVFTKSISNDVLDEIATIVAHRSVKLL